MFRGWSIKKRGLARERQLIQDIIKQAPTVITPETDQETLSTDIATSNEAYANMVKNIKELNELRPKPNKSNQAWDDAINALGNDELYQLTYCFLRHNKRSSTDFLLRGGSLSACKLLYAAYAKRCIKNASNPLIIKGDNPAIPAELEVLHQLMYPPHRANTSVRDVAKALATEIVFALGSEDKQLSGVPTIAELAAMKQKMAVDPPPRFVELIREQLKPLEFKIAGEKKEEKKADQEEKGKEESYAEVSKLGKVHLLGATEGQLGKLGRIFDTPESISSKLSQWAGEFFKASDLIPDEHNKIKNKLFVKGNMNALSTQDFVQQITVPLSQIESSTGHQHEPECHNTDPPFGQNGQLAPWLKKFLPPGFDMFFENLIKTIYQKTTEITFTKDGELQPWLIAAISNVKVSPPITVEQLNDKYQKKAVEYFLAHAVSAALREALLNTIPFEKNSEEYSVIFQFLYWGDLIFQHQYKYLNNLLNEMKAESNNHFYNLDDQLAMTQLISNLKKMQEILTKDPLMSIHDFLDVSKKKRDELVKERKTQLKGKLIIDEVVAVQPLSLPDEYEQDYASFEPTASPLKQPKTAPHQRDLTFNQQDGHSIKATIKEQFSATDHSPISAVSKIDDSLNTAMVLAKVACDFVDYNTKIKLDLFAGGQEEAQKFFKAAINEMRNNRLSINADALLGSLRKQFAGRDEGQLSRLSAALFQFYRYTTEQAEPYINDEHLPSDAFIRLARHQVESYRQFCGEANPTIVIGPDCWDPHYVEAIKLYCNKMGYPEPEHEGWNITLSVKEQKEKQKAFNKLYEEKFAALDKLTTYKPAELEEKYPSKSGSTTIIEETSEEKQLLHSYIGILQNYLANDEAVDDAIEKSNIAKPVGSDRHVGLKYIQTEPWAWDKEFKELNSQEQAKVPRLKDAMNKFSQKSELPKNEKFILACVDFTAGSDATQHITKDGNLSQAEKTKKMSFFAEAQIEMMREVAQVKIESGQGKYAQYKEKLTELSKPDKIQMIMERAKESLGFNKKLDALTGKLKNTQAAAIYSVTKDHSIKFLDATQKKALSTNSKYQISVNATEAITKYQGSRDLPAFYARISELYTQEVQRIQNSKFNIIKDKISSLLFSVPHKQKQNLADLKDMIEREAGRLNISLEANKQEQMQGGLLPIL